MTPIEAPKEFGHLFDRIRDDESSALDRLFAGSALREGLDELLAELAQAAREEEGYSWAEVGKVLEITRQAAQQRFGKPGVIRVSPTGEVTVSHNRKRYEAALREAVEALEPSVVEIEVEVEVPIEVAVSKVAAAKAAKKSPAKKRAAAKR